MAASSGAVRGYGSTVRVGLITGEAPDFTTVFTKLSGVEEFEFPDQTPDNEDVTHLDSPGDTEEFIMGMKKAPIWPLNIHYAPGSDTDTVLSTAAASGEDVVLELTAVGATPVQYAAYLNSWRPTGINPRNKMMGVATFTVKAVIEGV